MAFEFKLPDIGEGVAEGEIVAWLVKAGDAVKEDDPMVEVMTDKATVTIGAPKTGRILELKYAVGAVAPVGSVLVTIEVAGGAVAAAAHVKEAPNEAAKPAAKSEGPAATAVGDIRDGLPGSSFFQTKKAPAAHVGNGASMQTIEHFSDKPLATPATRKLARDLGVDLRKVKPSGASGRVTKDDVRGFVGGAPTMSHQKMPAAPARAATAVVSSAEDVRKPFVGIRRKIAERMQQTKNTAAHFTFVEECDTGKLTALRDRLRPAGEAAGVKLSYLPFIAKATVAALKKHPTLNTALDEATNELVTRGSYHLGIAAATDQGLMVPVVQNADRLSILDLAREIDRLGNGARAGTLKPSELSGSTFTITSLGKQGGLFATPILNHPEVGILGVHQIKQKPVVKDGQIVIGEVMLLSLSFDHRIVDGHVGAAFAYELIGYLEEPDKLFLEMV